MKSCKKRAITCRLIFLTVLMLAQSCISDPVHDSRDQWVEESGPKLSVYVVRQTWHSGIMLRRSDVPSGLLPEALEFAPFEYIEFGWGDREYYIDPNPGLWKALRAALWPTAAVMHVAAFKDPPRVAFPPSVITEIVVNPAEYRALSAYIDDSFMRESRSRSERLQRGLYGDASYFFPATGTFHLLNTCNDWTERALKKLDPANSPQRSPHR